MKRFASIVLFCFLLPACLEKAGPGAGGAFSEPAEPAEPTGAAMQDTPPIAGPSEDQDAKPQIPVGECKEENGVNCPEKLAVSRKSLCARAGSSVNPVVTGSEAVVASPKPLASNGQVTVKIWPAADLEETQRVVAADGTVSFHLVAGQKTGYYEFWVFGDLDTAYGDLTVSSCGREENLAPNFKP